MCLITELQYTWKKRNLIPVQERIDKSIATVGVATPISQQGKNKQTENQQGQRRPKRHINQPDLINVCKTLNPTVEYTLYPNTCETCTNINHGPKPFGAMKQISANVKDSNHTSIFSNHNEIKSEINNEKCLEKNSYLETK